MFSVKRISYDFLEMVCNKLGYDVNISKKPKDLSKHNNLKTLINLGSGDWECDGWINLDYPSEWYSESQEKHDFVPYDIRSDKIPFDDNNVDAIYCSHVIEHIEDKYIQIMFNECYRVLRNGEGVLRIACPDAEFIYQISKQKTDFWYWRDPWFKSSYYYKQSHSPRQVDYCVRELATPNLLYYNNGINQTDYINEFKTMDMDNFLRFITQNLEFRKEYVGDHINYWTFEKMKTMLEKAGFKTIIRSKYGASSCINMIDKAKFDLTNPMLSLYVEAIK